MQVKGFLPVNTQTCKTRLKPAVCVYSHAHGLLQPLHVFAVAVNAVVQVGGGAGVLGGAESRRVAVGGRRVFRVKRRGAFALVLVLLFPFASPVSLCVLAEMKVCGGDVRLSHVRD